MKNRSLVLIAIATLTGATALSCASQSAATTASADPNATAPAPEQQATAAQAPATPVVGPPHVAWKDMTKAQRGRYMGAVIMPRMKEVFRAFDPKEFADINCATCHGENAKDRGFKMPNQDIFVLASTPEGFGALMKDKPEMMQFMSQKVKPEMAALLGIKEYDPQHPQPDTFGCQYCHTFKGQ